VTAADEWDDENGNPMLDDEDDGDWRDYDDDYREPDPEDADIARSYEEYAEHCDAVHGGRECDCGPSLAARASQAARDIGNWVAGPWRRLKAATWHPWTLRVGPAEVTLRLHADRKCGACGGRGWSYGLDHGRPDDRPPGYNTVGLCGCGSAIASLAESRRYLRERRDEPPF
jgi:hypothetical protein